MTDTERLNWFGFVTLLIVTIVMILAIHWPAPAQPQPQIDDLAASPDWLFLQFDNGSQWYMRDTSVQAIWAIPKAEARQLGYKVRIYGIGYTINCPFTIDELERRMIFKETKGNATDSTTD